MEPLIAAACCRFPQDKPAVSGSGLGLIYVRKPIPFGRSWQIKILRDYIRNPGRQEKIH